MAVADLLIEPRDVDKDHGASRVPRGIPLTGSASPARTGAEALHR